MRKLLVLSIAGMGLVACGGTSDHELFSDGPSPTEDGGVPIGEGGPDGGVCDSPPCDDGGDPVDPSDAGPDAPPAANFCPDFPYAAATCDDVKVRATLEFRDSDKDGVSDLDELCLHGTNPCKADTDNDGASDLVEIAYGSDPLDSTDNPRARGDVVFVMPFEAASSPPREALDFATKLQVLDVYFLLDTTGSMASSITSLKDSLASFIPEIRAEIPNVWVGHGDFKDYDAGGYGSSGDFVYKNYQNLTDDALAAVESLSKFGGATGGGDLPEGQIPALFAIATGQALPGESRTPAPPPCPSGRWGYPCFRDNAVPIVALITDAPMHNGPGDANPYVDSVVGGATPTYSETVAALKNRHARVIGIGQGTGGLSHMKELARDTGAVDDDGEPLATRWNKSIDSTIGDTVLDQIQTLAKSMKLEISTLGVNHPAEAVDVVGAFIDRIEANTTGDSALPCGLHPADDKGSVGYANTFLGVTAGSRVCFDVVVKEKQTAVKATKAPQLFRANVRVIGDGYTPLDRRDIIFLVPPMPMGH